MSSIRTMDSGPPRSAPDSGPGRPTPSADRDTSSRPSGAARAAARSASFSAAQTQSTSARPATADSPATTPPPPRLLVSLPSLPRLKETGPRLDAISTRPGSSALMEGEVRASVPGAPGGVAARQAPHYAVAPSVKVVSTTSYSSSRGVEGYGPVKPRQPP